MFIKESQLSKQSKVMDDYFKGSPLLQDFFDYDYQNDADYSERRIELGLRKFQREALTEHLLMFNKNYQCSTETVVNIEKFLDDRTVVVVGGQQAGVLTGPLYTIHKIITILKFAKRQEELLQVPVLPVFWIAGEDHDFEEINHIYSVDAGKLHKRKVKEENQTKKSVSELTLNKDAITKLVRDLFLDTSETIHTKSLVNEIHSLIVNSETYIDLFAAFIHKLFKHSGIILLDSHHPDLRKLEIPFFKQLVEENQSLNEKFLHTSEAFLAKGYGEPIERAENNAHLFYHLNGTRLLLERQEHVFVGKQQVFSIGKEDLVKLIEEEPHNFSNNVVTRPLMQEFLLPVLAFVGGPGEIAYWATLKDAFHLFNFKVPPVVPRLSMTFVEPHIEKWLEKGSSTALEVVSSGTIRAKDQLDYWNEKHQIDAALHNILDQVERIHLPLKELVLKFDKGLEPMALKNELIVKKELTYLAQKIEKSVRQKYDHEWAKFELIESNLIPNGGLQERSLNILKYLNEYGSTFVEELLELQYDFNNQHKFIYLG
ncbi:bacillithiol biosynthesis cysteine-adding enzyme BshC [Anaerobacillus alkaliphilus]|uniref:Putative cysteine ligase BshC n=1 Tax=Anaerobacillus alkaliphilus TaxID=1548597 RepID=A0A4Q0VNV7_9BACI|nr:bacillithiol biosynthesis cysteine-adding enzyme BshC [Anaerobacillus alkaliphilus]RXI98112.1 bacillithiol biosynthesis cysteine-adding enzyme BshC [Anaerobacillus alkaliphilus]